LPNFKTDRTCLYLGCQAWSSIKLSQFISYSINTVVIQFLSFVISVVSSVITARALGPDGKGLYTLAILIPMLSVTFGRMGIGHAANYMAPKIPRTTLIPNVAILSAALGLITVIIALPATYLLKDIFFKELNQKTIFFIVLAIPLYMLYSHLTSLVQALYEIRFYNFIVLIQSLTNLFLLVVLVIIANLNLIGAIIASISATALVVLLLSVFILKKIRIKQAHLNLRIIKGLCKFGLKTHIGNVFKDLSYRVDILIISYFLPASSVGFYVAAVNIAEIIWKIPDSIGAVLLPRVAKIGADSAKELTPAVSRIVFVMVSFIAIFLALFSRKIVVLLFGFEFQPSNVALLILLPGMISLTVWKIIAIDLIAEGYPARYSLTAGVSLIATIILDLLLIPKYGVGGAAFAATAAYISATVAIICIYTRFTHLSFFKLFVPSITDLSIYRSMLKSLATGIMRSE
jgi:O-antigen/teichoic acid export membrane protein